MSQPQPLTYDQSQLVRAIELLRLDFIGVATELQGGFADSALARAKAGLAACDEALGNQTCPLCNQTFRPAFVGARACNWCAAKEAELANNAEQ